MKIQTIFFELSNFRTSKIIESKNSFFVSKTIFITSKKIPRKHKQRVDNSASYKNSKK